MNYADPLGFGPEGPGAGDWQEWFYGFNIGAGYGLLGFANRILGQEWGDPTNDLQQLGFAIGDFTLAIEEVLGFAELGIGLSRGMCGLVRAAKGAGRAAEAAGGRLGSAATRRNVGEVADELRKRGWDILHGGGGPEEYIRPLNGGRAGGSYADITAVKNGRTLRVNTVDTLSDGVTPTRRELRNARRMRRNTRGGHVLLVPKPKL